MAAGGNPEGMVRLINNSEQVGPVSILAIDESPALY